MLSTEFCGFSLENPFLLASGPATRDAAHIGRGFEAGWAGAVTKTISLEPSSGMSPSPRFATVGRGFLNLELLSPMALDGWLTDIESLKTEFPGRMVIASIAAPAYKLGDWTRLAALCKEAGSDAVELNLSCPHGVSGHDMGITIGQNPELTREVTSAVSRAVDVPVIVKLGSNSGDAVTVAEVAAGAGAAGVSAINTMPGLGEIDVENLEIRPSVDGFSSAGGYSGPPIKPVALRIVADISKTVKIDVSGIGGVAGWQDACEFILVGARTVQVCTAVMLRGVGIVDELSSGLREYLTRKRLPGLRAARGLLLERIVPYQDLKKGRVTPAINTGLCLRDDLCYISCRDAGGGAITLDTGGFPSVDREKCLGCSLCLQVCPSAGCIVMERLDAVIGAEETRAALRRGEAGGAGPGGKRRRYGSCD